LQHDKFHLLIGLLLIFIVGSPLFSQSQTWESGSASAANAPSPATPPTSEPKRLFGVVPNYRTVESSTPFVQLTRRQKLAIAAKDSFDWPTFPTAAFTTVLMSGKSEYGSGWSGFANRYVRNSADQIIGNMLTEGVMPIVFHEDPRYFRVGPAATFWSRLGSALSQIAVARDDKDRKIFNTSEFVGNAIAVGISNTYSPSLRNWPASTGKLGLMVGTDMLSNVIKEFGPDVKQHLFHRHHDGT
jgi:hypothetical protein